MNFSLYWRLKDQCQGASNLLSAIPHIKCFHNTSSHARKEASLGPFCWHVVLGMEFSPQARYASALPLNHTCKPTQWLSVLILFI
jgi:hypothetical protein